MGVSSSTEFVARWHARFTDNTESCSLQTRKRSLEPSPSPCTTHVIPSEDVSPSKKFKYIKEGIDESIERARKGEE